MAAYIRSTLRPCDIPGCPHQAGYLVYVSPLVKAGYYCAPHAAAKCDELNADVRMKKIGPNLIKG